jgi:hypothetical protein
VIVLFLLLFEIHAGFAVLVDKPELELIEVFSAEFELARAMLAAFYFAVKGCRPVFLRFSVLLLVAHDFLLPLLIART